MEKFLQAAAVAWNPVGMVRRRMEAETLSAGSVLVPFLATIVACNIFSVGAQKFFYESLLYALGSRMPDLPLLTNSYSQQILSAMGVLLPAGAVALLPQGLFRPVGRSATIAAMLAVAAAWSFYGAAVGVPLYFSLGAIAAMNPLAAINIYQTLGLAMGVAVALLTLFFWLRITLSLLGLRGGQVAAITLVAVIGEAIVAALLVQILSNVVGGR